MIVESPVPETYKEAYELYRRLFDDLVQELMNDPVLTHRFGEWGLIAHSQGYTCDNYPPEK
jgi:hypothetical protein